MLKQIELKKIAYQSQLKSRPLSVLLYLIDRSDKALTCFPSLSTIADQLHISVSTVKRALRELSEVGYIEKTERYRENGGQSSNLYKLVLSVEQKINEIQVEEPIEAEQGHIQVSEPVQYTPFDDIKAEYSPKVVDNKKVIELCMGYCITGYLEPVSEHGKQFVQIWLNALRDLPVEYRDASYGSGVIMFKKIDTVKLKEILDRVGRCTEIPIRIEWQKGWGKRNRDINDLLCENWVRQFI